METDFEQSTHTVMDIESGTEVFDVVLLRFYFETDGVFYNLGVVSDIQTGSNIPWNEKDENNFMRTLLAIVLLILLIVVISPILPTIFNIVIWVISLPFKFFKWLFGSSKIKKKQGRYRK